jgi:hypothetical protein
VKGITDNRFVEVEKTMDYKSNYLYAFAYRKIIVDKEGKPTDYEFIEVNKAFERLVTSNELTMIGKSRRYYSR